MEAEAQLNNEIINVKQYMLNSEQEPERSVATKAQSGLCSW